MFLFCFLFFVWVNLLCSLNILKTIWATAIFLTVSIKVLVHALFCTSSINNVFELKGIYS